MLNSLDIEMMELIWEKLKEWKVDDAQKPKVVFMQGTGGKAFCAGGDIKSVYEGGVNGVNPEYPRDFFAKEYIVDYGLTEMDPIQIPIWNGIVMGGGVGRFL